MKKCKLYRFGVLFVMLLLLGMLTGCKEEETEGTAVMMSYIGAQNNKVVEKEVYLLGESVEAQLEEVLTLLAAAPQKLEYQVPLSQGITVLTTNITNHSLVLNLSKEYKQLNTLTEILTRASLVKSLTQIEGIDSVTIHIDGEPLRDSLDKAIGAMTADMFIDNAGKEISTYEKVTIRLYFANEAGDGLIAVDRSKAYNTNISLEKLVMEQLIAGPGKGELYPTIHPETKINNVTIKDGLCYVNLNENFLTQMTNATSEVTIYSIVNSLIELPNVNKVQISINGDTEGTYRESIPFSTIFERNLELMD